MSGSNETDGLCLYGAYDIMGLTGETNFKQIIIQQLEISVIGF